MRWNKKSLDELGYVSRGRSRHRPRDAAYLYGGPYPFIQTSDVKHSNLYITDYTQTYSEEGLLQSRMWPAGTLCITIAANIADTAILSFPACFPDSIIGFIPNEREADARFIKYLFDALLQRRYQAFTQGAAQDNLSQSKLLSIKFRVPNIGHQRRIADIVSTYDDLIGNNWRRIELLEQMGRLLYKEWFVHLRFPGHERVKIIDGVLEGWKKKPLSEVAKLTYGFSFKSRHFNEKGLGLPVARIRDIPRGFSKTFTPEDAPREKLLADGELVIGMDGDFHMNFWVGGKAWINQRVVRISPSNNLTTGFLRYALEQPIQFFNSTIVGTTVAHLGAKHLNTINVIVPPQHLLIQINEILEVIRKQIVVLGKQCQVLAQARDLLLPRLMNGEIAV